MAETTCPNCGEHLRPHPHPQAGGLLIHDDPSGFTGCPMGPEAGEPVTVYRFPYNPAPLPEPDYIFTIEGAEPQTGQPSITWAEGDDRG